MNKKICYKNSPISEVVFEIKFKNDIQWDPTIPGLYFEEIHKKFPEKNRVHEGMVELQFSPNEKNPKQNFSQNELPQFLTKEKNIFVIVKKNGISIHHLKDYSTWENFYSLINFAYDKYVEAVKKATGQTITNSEIEIVNLRYINKISIKKEGFKLSDYFTFNPSLNENQKDLLAFMVGNVIQVGDDQLKIQAHTTLSENNDYGFILNLDYYTTSLTKDISEWTELAHNTIKDKFLLYITQKTKDLFN